MLGRESAALRALSREQATTSRVARASVLSGIMG